MHDITAVIENPSEYGFVFLTETVKRDGRTSGPIQLVKITDVTLFEKNFPGWILATEDGSSTRVKSQAVARSSWFDHQEKDQKSQQTRQVRMLLNLESPQLKYGPGPDGQFYATPEEVTEAWLAQVTK